MTSPHELTIGDEPWSLFESGLRVMQSLNLETTCESVLEVLSELCSAQGAALWLGRNDGAELAMQGYRGILEVGILPMAWNPGRSVLAPRLVAGAPVLVERDMTAAAVALSASAGMLVPLAREGKLAGCVLLLNKLGGAFSDDNLERARTIAACAAIAVTHAQRMRHLERVGLRDPSTTAYNMTYFVDYLGRELHKARRYRRGFALVRITVDNLASLKESLTAEQYSETLRQLVVTVSSVLRDIDVLARVNDDEMCLLLPETDFLGGLTFSRAARDAIHNSPFLSRIDSEHAINLSFGPAAFPRDGDDVDQLFEACARRIEEARRSLFRRLHLEDTDFRGAFDLLVGSATDYDPERITSRAFSIMEDERGLSRHNVFAPAFPSFIRSEILAEAARQGRVSGWLFIVGPWASAADSFLRRLRAPEAAALRIYWLSPDKPESTAEMPHITTVQADGNELADRQAILFFSEHAAYGLLAKPGADGQLVGFHTADWTLVEGLISKLQDAYHLQKGGT